MTTTQKKGKPALPLHKVIDEVLPRRKLGMDRDALIATVVNLTVMYKGLDSRIKDSREKLNQAKDLAKKLKTTLQKAAKDLKRIGITESNIIIDTNTREARLLVDEDGFPENDRRLVELYVLCRNTMMKLQEWESWFAAPVSNNRPKSSLPSLTAKIRALCRKAGLSRYEQKNVFAVISDAIGESISLDTLEKREQRAIRKRIKTTL